MLEILCKNPEIKNFLSDFPSKSWLALAEMLIVYSIRKLSAKNLNLTFDSIALLVSLTPCNIKHTIESMKQDLKDLRKVVNRIESTSSSPIASKRINSSSQVKKFSVQFPAQCFSPTHGIKEPKICDLNDAHQIISSVKAFKVPLTKTPKHDRVRVKLTSSTQSTSPQALSSSPQKLYKFKGN